ncbi:response regulator transcription factor [Enterobacter sp. CC120223-11]|uniref:response regulator transcription factor n=1 Tax=Enterobacter sp. CC120223-11 TaxID=1378073 RepID=UPI000BD60036|nr:response regulator transcription factor [Enterobacter sp. CC120223-11]SNY79880.1 two-component system, NarL family, response regulator EvgA [Enterobacter sp. CC120223-11]
MKKALIVDDHPPVRMALRYTLDQMGYRMIDECADGIEAIQYIKKESYYIVILDIGMPGMDGMSVIHSVRKAEINSRILVYTAQQSELYASRCMKAGASGFVSKNDSMDNVAAAIRALTSGYNFFPNFSFPEPGNGATIDKLSNRELDVLRKLAAGMTNNEIAGVMCLSNKTISTYKTRIMEKLGATSLVELITIAKQEDLQ